MLGFLAALAAGYLAVLLVFRVLERQLIFFPDYPGRQSGDWHPAGLPVEDVWLQARDGVKLHAWWIPAEGSDFTFVAFHGNAGNISHRADVFRFLHALPANLLAVEYRGYGRSEGSPSEAGLYLDAQAAYDYLTLRRGTVPWRIISYGQSLGTAVAVDLAANRKLGGVVLEAPFASARAVARRVYPYLPGLGWIAQSKFETGSKLGKIRAPLLVVHCAQDPVLAFPLGEEVYRLAREPKSFLRIAGTCHEEAFLAAPAEYRARLVALLTSIQTQN